jgi:hypothetical protein
LPLETRAGSEFSATVTLKACDSRGLFYGLVSLCQLLDGSRQDDLRVPIVSILDWPETNRRLAKAKASHTNSVENLRRFADLLPVFKVNLFGLMDYSDNSKRPTPLFLANVKTICREERKKDVLQTIVYFCPFRGERYDFKKPEDRKQYAELLRWFMRQGASGIEVDYNDWGNQTAAPIEDVLTLACEAVEQKHPDAMILFCPPSKDAFKYRGPASDEAARVLARTPSRVWPFWEGASYQDEKILDRETAEAWIKKTGRKPFLWVNRVYPTGRFSVPLEGSPGTWVFKAERLPKDLNGLFEGVHLNMSLYSSEKEYVTQAIPAEFPQAAIEYFATVTDYLWNPQQWEARESHRRAQRFSKIMMPLIGNTGPVVTKAK